MKEHAELQLEELKSSQEFSEQQSQQAAGDVHNQSSGLTQAPLLKKGSSTASTSSSSGVKKLNMCNKLFLDIESLSKNMQALLNNYEMLVIAQVNEVKPQTATAGNQGFDKFGLNDGEMYFKCKVDKVEHIVNFTCQILNKMGPNDPVDYSFTDYVCK